MDSPDLVWLAWAALLLLFLLGVLWLSIRVFGRVWRIFWGQWWLIFGDTLQARVIGLGVAVFLFPAMITGPYEALKVFLQTMVSKPVGAVAPFAESLSKGQSKQQLIQAALMSLNALANILGTAVGAVFFPITPIVFGLACWVVVGQLLSGGTTTTGTAWLRWAKSISTTAWKDAALLAVLLAGAYLSIAAITAIPSLQKGETPIESDKNRLTQQLAAARLTTNKDEFLKAFKEPEDLNPFGPLREALGLPAEHAPSQPNAPDKKDEQKPDQPQPVNGLSAALRILAETRPEIQSVLDDLKRWIQGRENRRNELRRALSNMRDTVFSKEDSAQKKAADAFDPGMVGRMGARERSRYIRSLEGQYESYIGDLERSLRGCMSYVAWKETDWQSGSTWRLQMLGELVRSPGRNFPVSFGSDEIAPICGIDPTSEFEVPPAPNAVDDWGIFRFFAGWLLKSDSLPLASIAGMLGAGLLGAAASSFIRQKGNRAPGQPLVDDLAGIVIRGFSAAIVIFLAVQGGLNVFSTSTGDPNPYVLLCTCLVGSVFSEDVWTRARAWLKSSRTDPHKTEHHPVEDQHAKEPGKELVKVEHGELEPVNHPEPRGPA